MLMLPPELNCSSAVAQMRLRSAVCGVAALAVTRELLFDLENNRQDNGQAVFPSGTFYITNGKLQLATERLLCCLRYLTAGFFLALRISISRCFWPFELDTQILL